MRSLSVAICRIGAVIANHPDSKSGVAELILPVRPAADQEPRFQVEVVNPHSRQKFNRTNRYPPVLMVSAPMV